MSVSSDSFNYVGNHFHVGMDEQGTLHIFVHLHIGFKNGY